MHFPFSFLYGMAVREQKHRDMTAWFMVDQARRCGTPTGLLVMGFVLCRSYRTIDEKRDTPAGARKCLLRLHFAFLVLCQHKQWCEYGANWGLNRDGDNGFFAASRAAQQRTIEPTGGYF